MDIFKWLFLLLFGVTVFGCQSPPHERLEKVSTFDLADAPEIELVPDATFSMSSYRAINTIGDIAVDEDGNIYVAEMLHKKIHVLDKNGTHRSAIGGIGSDPGEFQQPGEITIAHNALYAFDENMYRLYRFSLGEYKVHSTNLNIAAESFGDYLQHALPVNYIPLSDSSYLVGFRQVRSPEDQTLHYFKVNEVGELISEQVMTYQGKNLHVDNTMTTQVIMRLPYARGTLLATDSQDHIYTVYTEDFLIQVHDAEGNYRKAYHYPFQKRSLVGSDVVEMYTNVHERRAIRGADLPDTWPAVAQFFIDDEGRLWVASITQNLDTYTWYVMEPSGEVLGSFELSRKKKIREVRNGYVYIQEFARAHYSHQILRYLINI